MAEKKKTKTTAGKKAGAKKKPVIKATSKKKAKKPVKKVKKKATAVRKKADSFPIVGIGASAGGLEALEAFFSHMPHDSNIAFVVIQHLSPRHKSIMGSLLAKCTEMDVLEMQDGMKIEPNRVYLNPPDKNVVIINGALQLMTPVKTGSINLPIDCFFRSMAEDLGEKAICIILSGTATDGTLGLKAVKGEGGIAMVQDPESAKYDGMPRSAINTGVVDFILSVEKIPGELVKYVRTPYIGAPKKIIVADDKFGNYVQKVFSLIRTATGHDLSHYKQTTIRRRIERRMAVHQIDRMSNYVRYLQETPAEVDILFKDMLIGVTNFFRDPDAFSVLEDEVFPSILKAKEPDSSIRIWTVGCSTGEEAYSIAILLSEAMNTLRHHLNIQIFASDIDAQAIDHARSGIYPDSIAADVSQERLRKFFIKEDNTYTVKKQLREMIIFATQNVIKDPPFSKIDLVSCRNLLIYMDSELQKKVLPLCHYTLNPQGILFLGPSESIGEFTDLFHPVDSKWKIFKRKDFFIEKAADYPTMPFYQGPRFNGEKEEKIPTEADIHNVAERVVLDYYAPPGVLVNEKYEIVHFLGNTDRYLKAPTGKASFNIQKMAREGLRLKLSTALHNAVRQKKTISYDALRIKHDNVYRVVDLTVRPLTEMGYARDYMLVMFDDKTPPDKPLKGKGKKAIKDDPAPIVTSLERELESTKEHLQTTIEEMETSNEELKSTNEELQSVNEELQSSNEELETSKEELQSTNEELVTVNTELQNKVDELSQANNDINNLLASTEIGTIFLDTDLYIKRFTPAMTKVFNLIQTDMGRPIDHITSKLMLDHLKSDAKEVLKTLIQKEVEVQDDHGNWYAMRISPYRTTENVIDGVVMTFVNITKTKLAEMTLRESEERFKSIFEQTSESIVLVDAETGALLEFNKRAHEDLGYTHEEFEKLKVFDFGVKRSAGKITKHLQKVLVDGFDVFETKQKTKSGETLNTQVSSKAVSIKGKNCVQSIWWRY